MMYASNHSRDRRSEARGQRSGVRRQAPGISNPQSAIRNPQSGFTLTELLVVITIIAILLGLLYGAIRTFSRYSRETITRGELNNMEGAWKQYYACYHTWPTNAVEDPSTASGITSFQRFDISDGDVQYEIGPLLARVLAGAAYTNGAVILNPDGVAFLELTRFDKQAAPVSAWGDIRGQRYFVKLDLNGDNVLSVPVDTNNNRTNIFRRVAVWTAHPDKPGSLIGSWQQ